MKLQPARYRLEVRVTPRAGLLDPPGKAIYQALHALGYVEVADVRVGKAIALEIDAASEEAARARAEEMCRKLLANPVTEDFEIVHSDNAPAAGDHR
ncbi:MAG: phosphoribosylformylglycinamidine synthase subunit PurS [Gemmatimonadota bacterium]|nr:phosphoribosylformylglycinamidine synthase subunit PurS [Gemmatimonadota bacterium]